ncbi:MAG: thioredoxin [Actinobacteria bacterium]|nr:thioredoxin [Actinomycetota bacterium]
MAEVVDISEQNFETAIINAGKPALVDFWAPWCGPCRMMHPVLESLAESVGESAVIGRCNVDDNPSLAGRFGVSAIPTMILFKGGNQVETMVGVTPEEELKKKIEANV